MRFEDVRRKGMEHPIGKLIREMLIKHGQLRAFCLRLGSAGGTSKSLKHCITSHAIVLLSPRLAISTGKGRFRVSIV
jgi:hypothetical protein